MLHWALCWWVFQRAACLQRACWLCPSFLCQFRLSMQPRCCCLFTLFRMRWVSGFTAKTSVPSTSKYSRKADFFLGAFVGCLTATFISELVVTFLIGLIGISFCLNSWLRKVKMTNPNNRKPCQVCSGVLWRDLQVSSLMQVH